jgi:hypothetical protein
MSAISSSLLRAHTSLSRAVQQSKLMQLSSMLPFAALLTSATLLTWDRYYDFKRIFSPKNLAKILAFFAQTTATFSKNLFPTMVFEKKANFFAKNWQKS